MRTLGLVALAASAAFVAPLQAQTVPDPDPYYGTPQLRLNTPAAAASASATASAAAAASRVVEQRVLPAPPMRREVAAAQAPVRVVAREVAQAQMRPPMPQMHVLGTRMHAPMPQPGQMMRRGGRHMGNMMPPHARRFTQFRRIGRGGMVPPGWFGPRFQVRNFALYGFPQPFPGGRWIRYYDDALLIDRDGRVRDARYGWDWDRYGERWDYDDRGVPIYAGDDDYDDYGDYEDEWAEGGDGYGPPCRDACDGPPMRRPPPPCGCYGYGPVTVTETVTTTAPVVETRTYYEYVTETVAAPRRHRVVRQRPVRRAAPPPRPRPGERG